MVDAGAEQNRALVGKGLAASPAPLSRRLSPSPLFTSTSHFLGPLLKYEPGFGGGKWRLPGIQLSQF